MHFTERSFALNEHDRQALEHSLDADLSMIRVHTGTVANAVARSLQADALTCGSDIYFRNGAYDPTTFDGYRLLAHEAIHVVQHARGGTHDAGHEIAVSRPDDPSEREAERLATLVAEGGRVRLDAQPCEVTASAQSRVIHRHVSFEHRMLGDMPTASLVSIATNGSDRARILQNQIELLWTWHQDPQKVDETTIRKLCPWIATTRLGPSGVLATYGELNALPDYLQDPVALDTVPADILLGILQVIRQEGYNQLTLLLKNVNPNVTFQYAACSPWRLSLINNIVETQALDAFTANLGVNGSDHYQGLLSRNACHFAPFSWYRWQASHLIARDLALRSYAEKDSSQKALLKHQALVYDGYADHFLEDSFAAGHLLNKTLVMQWFIEWAAGQSLLPVADWAEIKNMTAARQPGLAGLKLYSPEYAGPSNDPQTSEEAPTFVKRALATGIVPDGLDLGTTYQHYLKWLSSAVTQLASANVHDYYNENSLWVSSPAQMTPYEVYGDDTLFTGNNGGAGVAATSTAAQLSQQALNELLNTGKTSISVESIRQHLPTRAGTSSSNMQDLQTFNTGTLRNFCFNSSFPSFGPTLKNYLLGLVSPRLGVSSQDQNLTNPWYASLPKSGFNRVDVVTSGGRMFAGTNGYVYELNPGNGQVLRSVLVTGSIGAGDYTTRLSTDGQTLFVGVHGYVYGVSLSNWTTLWSVGVGGFGKFEPVSVLARSGQLYCASNGYVYQVNPSNGSLIHTLSLSSFGFGNYDTRIATDGTNLYAGTHGYVYGIPLSKWQAAWNVGVGGTGAFEPVSVLVQNGQLFAGSNGYVYQVNPSNGNLIHSLLVTGSVGVGDYTMRLATDGQSLFVGVHGYMYGVSITGNWSSSAWNVSVGGTTGLTSPVSVLANSGRLFAGANGYVYELNPSSGAIISSVLLASPYWVGDFATELATDGQDLLAGTHGYAYKVLVQANATGAQPLWAVNGQAPTTQSNVEQLKPTWKSIPGYLTWVSAAPDGSVWGVNTNVDTTRSNIFRWDGKGWPGVAGYLTQISVGSASVIWGVNTNVATTQDNIFRWNGSGWAPIKGYLTSVAVAADGSVWGVNTNVKSPNNNIFRWNGSGWDGIAGYLTDIAVTQCGTVWGVNAQQGANANNVYVWTGSTWDVVAGHMTGITAATDGTVLAVNAQQPKGTNNIYLWNGVTWDSIAGYLTQVSAASSAQIWGVNKQQPTTENDVYQYVPAWQAVAGYLTSVGVGVDGTMWGVNTNIQSPKDNIFRWTGSGWMGIAGYLTQIAVGSASLVWGVNANQATTANNIYRWNGTGWDSIAGYLTSVAVASDGTVWGVNAKLSATSDNIFVWNGINWSGIKGHLTAVSAAADGTVWGVDTTIKSPSPNIFQWNGGGWTKVSGYLTAIATAGDGTVWGVNDQIASGSDNVFRWDGKTWQPVTGHMTQIGVGNRVLV